MSDWLKLSGLNESASEEMREFAEKRGNGAEKIASGAKEKGGVAMLTYHHFKVKLPYYSDVAEGKFDFDKVKKIAKENEQSAMEQYFKDKNKK